MQQPHGHGETAGEPHRPVQGKFAVLLPLIFLNLVVSGFGDYHPLLRSATLWFAAGLLVLALYASDVGRALSFTVGLLVLVAAMAWSLALMHQGWIQIVVVAGFNALTALAPIAILRKVHKEFTREGVDVEVILGTLCAYLYIGSWFSIIYRSVEILTNSPFFAQPDSERILNYLYFSFITLTTTGYGDLSPAYGPGRMIAVVEAVIGQLYLVSVVAVVVSAFRKDR